MKKMNGKIVLGILVVLELVVIVALAILLVNAKQGGHTSTPTITAPVEEEPVAQEVIVDEELIQDCKTNDEKIIEKAQELRAMDEKMERFWREKITVKDAEIRQMEEQMKQERIKDVLQEREAKMQEILDILQ